MNPHQLNHAAENIRLYETVEKIKAELHEQIMRELNRSPRIDIRVDNRNSSKTKLNHAKHDHPVSVERR